ncbi:hypothetical protein PILCRDRAFT_12276 [Piloderma croceum F 1598]|uniref:Uncharacterized protein n=1 Tax=Piloderma croceum (strain F 1598) TaxID=765440 RepID=A0A0C3BID9_PILCF|nr:hypothetical protein PILCRDRAFT_12276 [Piloderma croceum F 1598]
MPWAASPTEPQQVYVVLHVMVIQRSMDPRYCACLLHDTILNTTTSCGTTFVHPADNASDLVVQ